MLLSNQTQYESFIWPKELLREAYLYKWRNIPTITSQNFMSLWHEILEELEIFPFQILEAAFTLWQSNNTFLAGSLNKISIMQWIMGRPGGTGKASSLQRYFAKLNYGNSTMFFACLHEMYMQHNQKQNKIPKIIVACYRLFHLIIVMCVMYSSEGRSF